MAETKENLRKQFLEKRDWLSADLIEIASRQIRKNLGKIEQYRKAQTIACYHSTGSEVKTHEIMQEILSHGKTLALPRVKEEHLVFCDVKKFEDLEKGEFGIMEPKQYCRMVDSFDLIIVPAVAMTKTGQRLGYGMGFYDRFLAGRKTPTIALAYSKSIAKNIPYEKSDVKIDIIVTEDEIIHSEKG
ncbi:MAG: 5-formyltetrahydrofolate cyclo-ligase [Thaumarchaeota archaeon]|nr:5-formyltetrahydrofolate cyclo-ligase [Nitrososphaerota archaeon]